MFKRLLTILALLIGANAAMSEDIHFDNEVYTLKYSALAPQTQGYGNEYFKKYENVSNWTKMVGIYYYPKENDPIKYAQNFDKTVENTDNSVLLKFIQNKKFDKAEIGFLVNGCENAKKYFEYDIYKFEKHPDKGMMVLKYAVKHYFTNDSEIKTIAEKIKAENDKCLETIISSPIPPIVEKDLQLKE